VIGDLIDWLERGDAGEIGLVRELGAEGATAPETLRQKDRAVEDDLESDTNRCPPKGTSVAATEISQVPRQMGPLKSTISSAPIPRTQETKHE
jgi:hypothetical protein